jgi:hypothetical protein
MDFRYLLIRQLDLAIVRVSNLTDEDINHAELNVIYIVDLKTLTEYKKGGKWKSIKAGKSKKK